MINVALKFLGDELQSNLRQNGDVSVEVIMENIALWDTQFSSVVENKIVITNVNIEEESSLKNKRAFQKNIAGGIVYKEPPVNLNLYILISANYTGVTDAYYLAQGRISRAIDFFNTKKTFTLANSPNAGISGNIGSADPIPPAFEMLKLNLELYTLTFEQINHLWGSLGGKQLPFVMYKVRLVTIDSDQMVEGSIIEEIQQNAQTVL